MARYRATTRGFIASRIVETGDEFDYEGEPASWMEKVAAKTKPKGKDDGNDTKGKKPRTKRTRSKTDNE